MHGSHPRPTVWLTDGEGGVAGVGGARVLVLVRDDHTCNQLSEFLRHGGPAMMRRRFIAHLTTQLGLGKGEGGGRKKGKRFSSGSGREALAEAERELLAEELTRLTGGEEAGEAAGKGKRAGRKRKKPEREGEDEGQGLARVQEIFEVRGALSLCIDTYISWGGVGGVRHLGSRGVLSRSTGRRTIDSS